MPTRDLATLGRTALLIPGLLSAVWIFSARALLAQPSSPGAESQQPPAWHIECKRLGNAAQRFRSEGDFVKAIAAGRDKLAIERRELPASDPAILASLSWLADV